MVSFSHGDTPGQRLAGRAGLAVLISHTYPTVQLCLLANAGPGSGDPVDVLARREFAPASRRGERLESSGTSTVALTAPSRYMHPPERTKRSRGVLL